MLFLKQSTASQAVLIGPFIDDTDGKTAETGLTIANTDIRLSANGGNMFAKTSGGGTHDEAGWYTITFDATDTATVGRLQASVDVAGALPVWAEFQVVEEAVYDNMFASSAVGPLTAAAVNAEADTAISDAALATAASLAAAQADLDIITDTDGVILGAAGVDLIWDEVITGGAHNVSNSAGRRLRLLAESGSYAEGAVWIDTINGTAGTADFENGTEINPVASIADANTIASSLGLSKFRIVSGSTITLAATQSNQVFVGDNWTLALGGQNVAGSVFIGANVSGVMAGTGTTQRFVDCIMGATSLIAKTHLIRCGIEGTLTAVEAGEIGLFLCHSEIAGGATWVFDFGAAIGNTNLNVRNYSGGIQLENMSDTGTDTASIEGNGQVIEGTCTGGSVSVRGNFTVSGITNITLSDDARFTRSETVDAVWDEAQADHVAAGSFGEVATEVASILVDTGTTIPGTITTLQADTDDIQTRLPAALVGGRIDADMGAISGDATAADNLEEAATSIVASTAKAGTLSTTQMSTNLTEATNDHYIGRTVIWTTGVLAGQASDITDYVGVNGVLTYSAVTDAPGAGDAFVIV